jgi:hypothetical protein
MSFDSDIRRFSKKTGVAIDEAVRTVAFKAFGMIVKKTPVDTGRARGNWNVSVATIDRSVDAEAKRPKAPSIKKGDGLKPIYIVNSLDYIQDLENGTSKQAPNGMVAITMNEIRGSL